MFCLVTVLDVVGKTVVPTFSTHPDGWVEQNTCFRQVAQDSGYRCNRVQGFRSFSHYASSQHQEFVASGFSGAYPI